MKCYYDIQQLEKPRFPMIVLLSVFSVDAVNARVALMSTKKITCDIQLGENF